MEYYGDKSFNSKQQKQDFAKDLLLFLEKIIERKIDYKEFITSIKFSNNMTDAVKYFHGDSDFIGFVSKPWMTKEEFITFALGHISTSPSDTERSYLIEKLYLFSHEPCHDTSRLCPNIDNETTKAFFEELVNSCECVRYSVNHGDRISPQLFFLESERGAGKTVFINYFFSKYNLELSKQKILWIRMDLDNGVINSKTNLRKYFGNKLLKIILKVYCKSPLFNFSFFIQGMKELIKKQDYLDEKDKEKLMNKFNEYVNIFHNNQNILPTDKSFNVQIINIMYNLLKRENYKIIYIIDNIDLLDKSKSRLTKLEHYQNSIINDIIPNLKENGIFLITYRRNIKSFINKGIAASAKSDDPKFYVLRPVGFNDIFQQKINVIKQRVSEIGVSARRNWYLKDWPEQVDKFYDFIVQISDFESIDDFFDYLQVYFTFNNRSKTQIIQLLYKAFNLSRKDDVYKYRFIEYLFLAGKRFPSDIFKYLKSTNNKIYLYKTERIYDNTFVPNLFNYPYVKNISELSIPFSETYLLIKIRIITFLITLSINYNESEIHVEKVIDFLNDLFNYDKSIILCCLDEFCEYEFIELIKEDEATLTEKSDRFSLTTKFFNYFSFFNSKIKSKIKKGDTPLLYLSNIFNSLAYLNMCAMKQKANETNIKNKLFYALPYDSINKSHEDTIIWLQWKIINSITLVKLIYETESYENKILEKKDKSKIKYLEKYLNNINYSNYIINNLFEEIKKTVFALDLPDLKFVKQMIEDHFTENNYGPQK